MVDVPLRLLFPDLQPPHLAAASSGRGLLQRPIDAHARDAELRGDLASPSPSAHPASLNSVALLAKNQVKHSYREGKLSALASIQSIGTCSALVCRSTASAASTHSRRAASSRRRQRVVAATGGVNGCRERARYQPSPPAAFADAAPLSGTQPCAKTPSIAGVVSGASSTVPHFVPHLDGRGGERQPQISGNTCRRRHGPQARDRRRRGEQVGTCTPTATSSDGCGISLVQRAVQNCTGDKDCRHDQVTTLHKARSRSTNLATIASGSGLFVKFNVASRMTIYLSFLYLELSVSTLTPRFK